MIKKMMMALLALIAASAFAAVDVNSASEADLDSIKGIGPGTSTRILGERKAGKFKDWADLIQRVSGIGEKRAAKLSAEGLTVNGVAHQATSTPAKPRLEKAATKATSPAAGASQ
ncbi:MAG: helix-hairpin-helix domain-containing protein [Hydrogenophaga sp.]|jgi:competence protein ComEA|nr:helix-hairpin-helix domain-containing protein [Hydrogenophaga sp.]